MWERFSFYGMKYLLLLYLTKYHLLSDIDGLAVLGSYASLVYGMPVIGGLIADRYLGVRKAVVLGGTFLVMGHIGMAFEGHPAIASTGGVQRDEGALQLLFLSLALIVVGVGFLKPNISAVVGKLYATNDPRRDAGFTIFYMGINTGAFVATLLCGWLGETYGWRYGFGAAGVGMLLGLVIFLWGQRFLEGHGNPPYPQEIRTRFGPITLEQWLYVASVVAVILVWQLIQFNAAVGAALNIVSVGILGWLVWFLARRCDKQARGRMIALVILIVFSVVFWSLFEQAAGSMTLYADRVTDRTLFGVTFTASQFGAAGALFIILLAPAFALLWTRLGARHREPSTPIKFALGIAQAGLGFGALLVGAHFPDEAGRVSAWWLILAYLLHTTGELCLSPVGLSAVTKLAVPSVVGIMMGTWFLATAYSSWVAARLAQLTSGRAGQGIVSQLEGFNTLFGHLMLAGLIAAAILFLATPLLRRLMAGVR
ncbi:amino acid/peptide transporter [Luminiphilus syltensis NOR5-1B]|uniref:Amino acid/peptide transporter n=1 Tax=Luminiphilus syltensis NOR5-1B TaxID=565045 RepID=B8KSZ6_9GAMM|nr:oligopeptide:H+ symporter [Luminiphilus syltensis]EED36027.1 amino acid/peptide transporter [Luminiphilus syltensis NOR5-1B]